MSLRLCECYYRLGFRYLAKLVVDFLNMVTLHAIHFPNHRHSILCLRVKTNQKKSFIILTITNKFKFKIESNKRRAFKKSHRMKVKNQYVFKFFFFGWLYTFVSTVNCGLFRIFCCWLIWKHINFNEHYFYRC